MKKLDEALWVQTFLAKADHYPQWMKGLRERLTPKILDHYLHLDQNMLQLLWCFLLIFSSKKTQIATKI